MTRPVVAVAASGGRDSTALLHATARMARELGLEVVALHVHHGLMPQADAWAAQVQGQCRRWARGGLPVRCRIHRLTGRPARGDSIEAWARRERYAALTLMAREEGASLVLLAHHRLDQAETVVLQALRGAGPPGLSAMPRRAEREGLVWCRPWLDHPRASIEAYVRRHRLSHVEDGSNHDPKHARSRWRQRAWPAVLAAFAQAEAGLAHAAARAQEAAACLAELAREDAERGCIRGEALDVAAWLALSPPRRANLLRHWLVEQAPHGVPDSLVERLGRELPRGRTGQSWPAPGFGLRLHRGQLRVGRVAGAGDAAASPDGPTAEVVIDLSRPGRHVLPGWPGVLELRRPRPGEGSLPASLLQSACVAGRRAGLQFQRAPGSTPRSLKKAFQEAGLGIDARQGPVLMTGGQVLFVAGLGTDARAEATPGLPRLALHWQPVAAGAAPAAARMLRRSS